MLDPKIKLDVDLISKLSTKNGIDNKNKIVLLIDELESVITLNDKVGVFNIIKDNNFNRWMPIVIITNNQHNKQLNEKTQVAIVQSGKLPKFFLKDKWQPMSAIALDTRMGLRHGKVSVYLKNTDLILEYADQPAIMDGINGRKIGYQR